MEAWLEQGLAYAASWLAFQCDVTQQPGLSVAIAYEGELVLDQAFGTADLSSGDALTPRHRIRVASHSKTFTAVAVMALVEEGRLRLDDRCGNYVEGLHPSVGAATIGQLLSHSGGVVRDGPDSGQFLDRFPYPDRDALLADLAAASPIEPGLRLKYSNHGYGLLGLVIEAVTGRAYVDWVAERVIQRAGLTETAPDIAASQGAPLASGHSGRLPLGRRVVVPGRNATRAMAPAAGFVSTAADLVRFFGQLDPAADTKLLSAAGRREMVRRHWRDDDVSVERHYGLGIMSGPPGPWAHFGHTGGLQGFITRTVVIPDQRLAVSVVTNAIDGPAYAWVDGIVHIFRRFKEQGAAPEKHRFWTGRFWTIWGAVDLVPVGERVLAALPALGLPLLDAVEIEVTGPDAGRIVKASGFASPGEPVMLTRGGDGVISELRMAGAHLRPQAAAMAEMEERYGA